LGQVTKETIACTHNCATVAYMKSIRIDRIEDSLHLKIKLAAMVSSKSLREFVLDALKAAVKKQVPNGR
jgi:hypothetical protein